MKTSRWDQDDERQAQDDARAEWAYAEAIAGMCEQASGVLNALLGGLAATHPLLRERRDAELHTEFKAYRETLELMTGEAWPKVMPEFLKQCDQTAASRDVDSAA
jgi:hypothetical protein